MSSAQFNFRSSGVKTTDKKFTKDITVKQPIGFKTPLELGSDIFQMHDNPLKQLSDNFRNLLMTNHGERLGRFNFGANLKSIVFDYSNTENFNGVLTEHIISVAQKYIPAIQILDVEYLEVDEAKKRDLNNFGVAQVVVRITYSVPKLRSPNMGIEIILNMGG